MSSGLSETFSPPQKARQVSIFVLGTPYYKRIWFSGELCVVKDEYLQVKEVVDRHWARCQTEHRVGLVPMSHVTSVDGIPKLEEGQALYLAVSDFHPDHQGDIRLKRGKVS